MALLETVAGSLMKDIVVPRITAFVKRHRLARLDAVRFEADLRSYLIRKLKKYEIIDTLAFPNRQTSLSLLYEPLSVETFEERGEKRVVKIEGFPEDFLPKFRRIVIQDTVGMGKSTLAKVLFRSAAVEKAGIPLLIELRKINKTHPILAEIQNQLSPLDGGIEKIHLLKLLNEGGFIFLLDGYDEVSTADQAFVQRDLKQFIEKADANLFLMTSRPEATMASFGDFQKFQVAGLTREEAFSQLKRYDAYGREPIAGKLIEEVSKVSALTGFLKSPLMVSLLYMCYEHKRTLPKKPGLFFHQVFDVLFEIQDSTKENTVRRERKTGLCQDDFDRLVRHVAYYTAMDNRVLFDKSLILAAIGRATGRLGWDGLRPGDFLSDLVEAVPLFRKDGPFVQWAHKSLQDYFAARFLVMDAGEAREKVLRKMYDDPEGHRFSGIVHILVDLDFRLFERTLLLWMLREYRDHASRTYRHAYDVPPASIERRVEATFIWPHYLGIFQSPLREVDAGWTFPNRLPVDVEYEGRSLTPVFIWYTPEKTDNPIRVVALLISPQGESRRLAITVANISGDLFDHDYKGFDSDEPLLETLEENFCYPVDDDPENPVNAPANFDDVTELLRVEKVINGKRAMEQLQAIERRLLEHNGDDLLNWASDPSYE